MVGACPCHSSLAARQPRTRLHVGRRQLHHTAAHPIAVSRCIRPCGCAQHPPARQLASAAIGRLKAAASTEPAAARVAAYLQCACTSQAVRRLHTGQNSILFVPCRVLRVSSGADGGQPGGTASASIGNSGTATSQTWVLPPELGSLQRLEVLVLEWLGGPAWAGIPPEWVAPGAFPSLRR